MSAVSLIQRLEEILFRSTKSADRKCTARWRRENKPHDCRCMCNCILDLYCASELCLESHCEQDFIYSTSFIPRVYIHIRLKSATPTVGVLDHRGCLICAGHIREHMRRISSSSSKKSIWKILQTRRSCDRHSFVGTEFNTVSWID